MEYATDIASARKLWESTNNTVGFNHMISSGKDAADYVNNGGHSIVARVHSKVHSKCLTLVQQCIQNVCPLSTCRESDALYDPHDGTPPVHIGFPLHEALWRTNPGYDPVIREHFEWSQAPSSWSMKRYMYIYNALQEYNRTKVRAVKQTVRMNK